MKRPTTQCMRLAALAVIGCGCSLAVAQDFEALRKEMVNKEIAGAGISDPRVLQSMRETPRHEFVDARSRPNAYYDMALAIGNAQTISPPFIVAYMTEQLQPKATDKVLEIGTGSGYQAAVLSPLVKEVYTIEIVKPLGEKAERALKRLTTEKKGNYKNVFVKVGDGYQGWPEHAPFDKIIVTCSPEDVPEKLVEQLAEGGRMLVPVGERYEQTLFAFEKHDGKLTKIPLLPMMFVPMTGQAEAERNVLPDPAHPSIKNGSFEQTTADVTVSGPNADKSKVPAVWYYQRQLNLIESPESPDGKHYVTFTNAQPGVGAHALEGMAVDGRKVKELVVTGKVRTKNVQPGAFAEQQGSISITFFDENRAATGYAPGGYAMVGPWKGTVPWKAFSETVKVPPKAREAIVRIGLSGATGEIAFDDLQISGK